jgi:hypothetical protein
MSINQVINIVGTQCQPKDEEKFNKWYNEVHVPMLMKTKKIIGVARYKLIGATGLPNYIALYKFANQKDLEAFMVSPEREAAGKEMRETWGKEIEVTSRVQYELVKEWGK